MILSYRLRFILLRAYKVAGTSVEMALSTACDECDVVTPMMPIDEAARQRMGGFCGNYGADPAAAAFYNQIVVSADPATLGQLRPPLGTLGAHSTLDEIVAQTGIEPADFRILGITRDPYARLISLLHMTRHREDYRRGVAMPEEVGDLAKTFDIAKGNGALARLDTSKLFGNAHPELLRYEQLASDLTAFATSLSLDLPALPHAKRGAGSEQVDPRAVFRRDQLDWFNAEFASEFTRYNYSPI